MTSAFADPVLVATLRQNLGPDFDQFDDEELEVVLTTIWASFEEQVESLLERFPYNPNLAVRV